MGPGVIALVLVAVLLAPVLAGGPGPRSHATPIPADLTANQWQTATTFRSYPLSNGAKGSLTFIFPDITQGLFGYLYSKTAYRLTGFSTYQASFAVAVLSGSPVFTYDAGPDNPCANPPHVQLFLWGTRNADSEFARWWSHAGAHELSPGTILLSADLNDLTDWSSVYGKSADSSAEATAGFDRARDSALIGLTFGGGCFAGHGVATKGGTARGDVVSLLSGVKIGSVPIEPRTVRDTTPPPRRHPPRALALSRPVSSGSPAGAPLGVHPLFPQVAWHESGMLANDSPVPSRATR
jgi:hypothetical protein